MFQLRSNLGSMKEFDTFTEAYDLFDKGYVLDSDGDDPEIWTKLSWTVEEVGHNTTRVILFDDGTYEVRSPKTLAVNGT